MRDEFDPVHNNPRKGWPKRKWHPSRQKVVVMFGELEEPELREVVHSILQEATIRENEDAQNIMRSVIESSKKTTCESA